MTSSVQRYSSRSRLTSPGFCLPRLPSLTAFDHTTHLICIEAVMSITASMLNLRETDCAACTAVHRHSDCVGVHHLSCLAFEQAAMRARGVDRSFAAARDSQHFAEATGFGIAFVKQVAVMLREPVMYRLPGARQLQLHAISCRFLFQLSLHRLLRSLCIRPFESAAHFICLPAMLVGQ